MLTRVTSCFSLGLLSLSLGLLCGPLTAAGVKAPKAGGVLHHFLAARLIEQQGAVKPNDSTLPDGPGKDLVQKTCTGCHTADTFSHQRKDKEHWNQVIDNMASKGLAASDDDLDKIATYLATYLGPDNATAKPGVPDVASPAAH